MLFLICILDGSGGKPKLKESSKTYNFWFLIWFEHLENQKFRCVTFLLETEKSSNSMPPRLVANNYMCNSIQEFVEKVDSITAIRSDHSAITIHINAIKKHGLRMFLLEI